MQSRQPTMLYHYTSVEALEKILNSESMMYRSFEAMDDPDESQSADMGDVGRYCFVSCWTAEREESIPQWSMYGHTDKGSMDGVRIGLPPFPFRRYTFPIMSIDNAKPLESYVDLATRNAEGKGVVIADSVELIQIDYTEKEELLYPKVRVENTTIDRDDNGIRKETKAIRYSFRHAGAFKRKCWAFQREWRYRLLVAPWTYDELRSCNSANDHLKLIGRIDQGNPLPQKEERMYLKLDSKTLSHIEVLMGPKIDNENRCLVQHLLRSCGLPDPLESELRIR